MRAYFVLLSFLFSSTSVFSSPFSMIFISDTQYPWACASGNKKECSDEKAAAEDAIHQVHWIRQKIQELDPQSVKGIVINGDLTAFGHKKELKSYRALWEIPLMSMGLKVYPGLGNHDYQNNVNDCYNNHCATRMVDYMRLFLATHQHELKSFDFNSSKVYYKFPQNRIDHKGSLSYSWDVGNVHFVQLHNHASYQTEWNSWNSSKILRDYYFIKPAYKWLRADLKKATKEGKKIIISMHDAPHGGRDKEFKKILEEFKVSAMFGGHYHSTVGQYGTVLGVPVFLSGASVYRSALVVHFDGEGSMKVEAYRGKQSRTKPKPPYKESTEFFELSL